MKRRDFIAKSTLGAATAGSILTVLQPTETLAKETDATSIKTLLKETANLEINGSVKEVMRYSEKARSGVVLGGIGAGGAEIRKDGVFYNWSIMNNAPKGTGKFFSRATLFDKDRWTDSLYPIQDDEVLFFIIRFKEEGKEPAMKLLQIINEGYQNAGFDREQFIYYFPWLSCVDVIEYTARFPYATLNFKDPEMPFEVEMTTWSPFIPNDVKNSSLPALFFDFKIKSLSDSSVEVMIMANYRNMAGYDIEEKVWTSEVVNKENAKYSISGIEDVDTKASSFGTMGFASLSTDSTFDLCWAHRHTHYEIALLNNTLQNTDRKEGLNYLKNSKGGKMGYARCFNTWAKSATLKKGENLNHSFIQAWNFPNLYDSKIKIINGHYYSKFFDTAKEVIEYAIKNRERLQKETMAFVNNYYDSTAPEYVLDMINSQLTTFITSSQLSKKMEFGIIEGITHHQDWGPVGTTDVNMYGGTMISALFPELQKSTMRVHKAIQHPAGEIRHSFHKGYAEAILNMPVNATGTQVNDRLDLPSQYVIMVMRDFFWTNDKIYLQEMWPSVKKALNYVLTNRDLDGDQQPDMAGIMCTYDNFPMYGMASLIQSQWLCAIAGALQAAKVLNDNSFVKIYNPVFEKGKKLADEKLWNGKYYRLYNSDLKTMKTKDGAGKEITKDMSGKDEGCLTDQIIGQWAAHMSGLGELFPSNKRKIALKSILELSYKPSFGLRNCSWPEDKFIHPIAADIWVDQANTCWTGVELCFASFLLYEGLYDEALKVIKTVDVRYRKAGLYFDHQEFGGHYFRPMGAWSIINGLVGLSVNQEAYNFKPVLPEKNYKLFFAFPNGTAHLIVQNGKAEIKILSGELSIKKLSFANIRFVGKTAKVLAGKTKANASLDNDNKMTVDFKTSVIVKAGESLTVA